MIMLVKHLITLQILILTYQQNILEPNYEKCSNEYLKE